VFLTSGEIYKNSTKHIYW